MSTAFNTCFCFAYRREKDDKKKSMKQESLTDLLSSDMHREMMRKKWEAEEEEMRSRGPGPLHYQNLKFDGKKRDLFPEAEGRGK